VGHANSGGHLRARGSGSLLPELIKKCHCPHADC
jgi:hypothetical protein